MLLPSGNDAAGAAAVRIAGSYEAFADQMNARAAAIGMTQTHFVTPSGLHDDAHYSTAYDMALLTAEALQNEDFREICGQSQAQVSFGNPPFSRWLTNSNKLLETCEGVIGVKTGFTDEAGRCLVSACQRGGLTLICVTLNDANDWDDHSRLYDAAFAAITPHTADLPDSITLPVAGGTSQTVSVYAKEAVTYGTLAVAEPVCRWEVEAAPLLYAPVKKRRSGGNAGVYLQRICSIQTDTVCCQRCALCGKRDGHAFHRDTKHSGKNHGAAQAIPSIAPISFHTRQPCTERIREWAFVQRCPKRRSIFWKK
jgi:D-alanyl-D-alanine carboxypeptidase/D-alanyl-D-alanine carboxypeptidase (penicillin-binding protein 5/6)